MSELFLDPATKEQIENEFKNSDITLSSLEKLAFEWRCLYPKTEEMRYAQKMYEEDFLVRMAYNSNAIEGSTLTLADTEIIYEGEFVPDKPGREQVAARGIFEGEAFISKIISDGAPLDENLLRDLHEVCALDLQPRARGMYRSTPAIIRASRTTPASPLKIRAEIANLLYRYEYEINNTHPLMVIPWFHAAFENIHPFADGNGRTGRLWMNAQLQKCAYPPICIKVDHSREYKSGLEAWQVNGDPLPFMRLFLECLKKELETRIDFLSQSVVEKEPSFPRRGMELLGILYYQPTLSANALAKIMGISQRHVQHVQKQLRDLGILEHIGSPKKGRWLIK